MFPAPRLFNLVRKLGTTKAKLFFVGSLLSVVALCLIVGGSSSRYNDTSVVTITTKEDAFVHIQVQPFQNPPPNECCPFAQTIYDRFGEALNYRCCTDRLDSLEDLRNESLTLASFQALQNTSILLQGDSLAEQHFVSLLCFTWRYGDEFQTNLTKSYYPHPKNFYGWKATIQPWNISIEFLRWYEVEVSPTKGYQEDFVILGGWHHDGPDAIINAVGPFVERIQSLRAKRQHAIILSEALPAHFPGGGYAASYPPATALAKYYPKNKNGTYTKRTPFCDSSAKLGEFNGRINGHMKKWTQRYNLTFLAAADIYKDRGDAHIGKIPTGRDCLHWCVEALDAWALKTWYLLATLKHSSREGGDNK